MYCENDWLFGLVPEQCFRPVCPPPCPCPPRPEPAPCPPTPQPLNVSNTIIPFASGVQFTMTSGTETNDPSIVFVGFGYATSQFIPFTNPLDLSTPNLSFAFQMPRSGLLKNLTVTYTLQDEVDITEGQVTLYAQLYVANQNSNLYSPIAQSLIQLTPNLTGTVPVGTIFTGTANNINVNISQNQKLVLVIYAMGTNTTNQYSFNGVLNGGLLIR